MTRYALPASGDEAVWRKTVRPIYVRVCADCHAPGGSSGIDLSSYASWVSRRTLVHDRVVVKRDMPQGRTLDDTELAAINDWSSTKP
jgi:hypothetical protein